MINTPYENALHNLGRYWGFDRFRPGQDEVVESVLAGNETVVLFPTGGGKSLCFQVPATVLPGLTLVISPLVALMQDQVDQLVRRGIKATFINSTLKAHEVEQRLINARNGMYTLLYCAPERLETALFRSEAPDLNIQLVAVDEAHCISEWGHDFRPPYRNIRANIEEMIGKTRWMALTATATPKVREDIINVLGFTNPVVISKGFARENLKWWVTYTDQKNTRLLQMIKRAPGSGLVYAGTRRACNELAETIRLSGIPCEAYHAGLPPESRKRIQQEWIDNTLRIVVATNAFGMGIDKPDCRFVIHYDLSYSLEAYYQEAGRAGRDGSPSYPTLLVRKSDLKMARKRLNDTYPTYETLIQVYSSLCDALYLAVGSEHPEAVPVSTANLMVRTKLSQTTLGSALRVLNRLGVIEMAEHRQPEIGLLFHLSREAMLERIDSYANEAKKTFLDNLVRLFAPEGFQGMHFIETDTVLSRIEVLPNALRKGLGVLRNEGLLDFQEVDVDPMIRLVGTRQGKVPLSREESEAFRKIQQEKLEHMIGYIESSGCRSAYIRRYFGEIDVPDSCGFCDRCLAKSALDAVPPAKEQLQRVFSLLRGGPQTLSDIGLATGFGEDVTKAVLKWLNNEGKIRYERKTGLFRTK
jgi:ATP-dependent DNA helicase RecQ